MLERKSVHATVSEDSLEKQAALVLAMWQAPVYVMIIYACTKHYIVNSSMVVQCGVPDLLCAICTDCMCVHGLVLVHWTSVLPQHPRAVEPGGWGGGGGGGL